MNRMISCKDVEASFDRSVVHSCGNVFEFDIDNIYAFEFTDYDGVDNVNYYTICPRCGYMVCISNDALSSEEKNIAREKNIMYEKLYTRNDLVSRLINLDMNNGGKMRILK